MQIAKQLKVKNRTTAGFHATMLRWLVPCFCVLIISNAVMTILIISIAPIREKPVFVVMEEQSNDIIAWGNIERKDKDDHHPFTRIYLRNVIEEIEAVRFNEEVTTGSFTLNKNNINQFIDPNTKDYFSKLLDRAVSRRKIFESQERYIDIEFQNITSSEINLDSDDKPYHYVWAVTIKRFVKDAASDALISSQTAIIEVTFKYDEDENLETNPFGILITDYRSYALVNDTTDGDANEEFEGNNN